PGAPRGVETENRAERDTLARARFAQEGQDPSGIEREGDVVHCTHDPVARLERHAEISDIQECHIRRPTGGGDDSTGSPGRVAGKRRAEERGIRTPETTSSSFRSDSRPVLVTGASGYVGGRLVRRLLEAGWHVRCVTRSPGKLAARPWATETGVEIVKADTRDADAMVEAMRGCGSAFYLVHSMMASGARYAADDRHMAEQFVRAAAAAGLARIVYLGGLGEAGPDLSEHLASRRDVERVLTAGPVPVTVLRAAMIVGAGSASFEILRYLVERLPIMVTPRWVHTECQPIAVDNVVTYLVACLDTPGTIGRTFDVGGPDVVTYRQLMDVLADEAGLRRRLVIPVPVLTPRLSSLWIHLVTPVSHRIARPLAEGLRNRVVCRDDTAQRLMPQRLLTAREAIRLALDHERAGTVETAWTDAGLMPGDPDWAGGTMFTDRHDTFVDAPPDAVWRAVCRLGGRNGWYADRL